MSGPVLQQVQINVPTPASGLAAALVTIHLLCAKILSGCELCISNEAEDLSPTLPNALIRKIQSDYTTGYTRKNTFTCTHMLRKSFTQA